ncbi:hypothetical protein [Treponema sp. R80B11-R83G3]
MDCKNCDYMGTKCFIRYWKDVNEFGVTEWICPVCDKSHLKHDADFICDNCGFTYECQ